MDTGDPLTMNANTVSDAQLAANRANAAQSTGPKSPEGKSRSRLNGLRHGLTGQTVVMPHEDRKAYERHTARIFESLKPENDLEWDLAQSIADDKWRLNRARAIEENIFAIGANDCPIEYPDADARAEAALTQSETFLRFAKELQLLTLYETRINRNLKSNTAELNRLQTQRRADEARALEEATLLAELAESKGETYDPKADGFAFSTAELTRQRDRIRRLNQARKLASQPKPMLKKAA
jgi:hypothetical protein